TESGPDSLRIASILSPISLIAVSQEMRVHFPSTSFNGYFSRRSEMTSSREAAPLAQCPPILIGLSKSGSCPIQTPFWTSALIPHPTEQNVQTLCLIWILPLPAAAGAALSAFLTIVNGIDAKPAPAAA